MMDAFIYLFIFIGVFISFFNLPGPWFIFIASLFATMAYTISPATIVVFFLLAIFASVADNVLVLLGAKYFGGGKWGMIGAVFGLLFGITIGNIVGAILGPFLGAYLFEYLIAKKESKEAFRAGLGTIVGLLGSIVMKVVISLGMTVTLLNAIR